MEVEFKMFEVEVDVEAEEEVVMVKMVQLRPELGAAQVWRQAQDKSRKKLNEDETQKSLFWQHNGI